MIMIIINVIIKSEEQKYYIYLCAFKFHDLLYNIKLNTDVT